MKNCAQGCPSRDPGGAQNTTVGAVQSLRGNIRFPRYERHPVCKPPPALRVHMAMFSSAVNAVAPLVNIAES